MVLPSLRFGHEKAHFSLLKAFVWRAGPIIKWHRSRQDSIKYIKQMQSFISTKMATSQA